MKAQDKSNILGLLLQVSNVTLLRLKLWHALAVTLIVLLVHLNSAIFAEIWTNLEPHLKSALPIINLFLQLIPFVAVSFIWVLRKLLDEQIDRLSGRLQEMEIAAGNLHLQSTHSTASMLSASIALNGSSQTAATGLSTTASIAVSDISQAAEGITASASSASEQLGGETKKLKEEAEVAQKNLSQQTDRMRDEIERLMKEIPDRLELSLTNFRRGLNLPSDAVPEGDNLFAQRRDAIRAIWRDSRDKLGQVIDHVYAHEDGRRTRHLKLNYRNYRSIADELYRKGFISAAARQSVHSMDGAVQEIDALKSKATQEQLSKFDAWARDLAREVATRLPEPQLDL